MDSIEEACDEYRQTQEQRSDAAEFAARLSDPSKIALSKSESARIQPRRKNKRRGTSEGTVFRRKSDGRWVASVNVGWRGARRRRLHAYCATQADAIKALATLRQQNERGLSSDSANLTLTEYAKRWIAALDVKPRTSASYKWLLDSYVLPALGGYKLSTIRARDVRRLLGELR
jgi:hypothetical protein